LNRFLFDSSELDQTYTDVDGTRSVTLPKDDYRTVHAAKILGLHNGDTVRAGIVSCELHDGLLTDKAVIQWVPEGKVKKAEVLKNGNPPGSLQFRLKSLAPPPIAEQATGVNLMLALPRPLQLGRMLPMIAQLGVDHVILTEARKVPKDYWGSHLFRRPEELRLRLVEGLCQAGDVKLPKVHTVRNLSSFLEGELDTLFPASDFARVIAHPQRDSSVLDCRMRDVEFPPDIATRQMVVAVGPEGGWEEPNELERFQRRGFQQITLGKRTLRTDVAVISLLSLAHDVCATDR
jgi:RsmE family RNA methyltransferase